MIPLMALMIVCLPLAVPIVDGPPLIESHSDSADAVTHYRDYLMADTETGSLNPVVIEHTGEPSGTVQYLKGRTDIDSSPSSEVWLPAGSPANTRSADCTGGYFLVGASGAADFSSPEGTISMWIKWDVTAPHGRFWGQDYDFETRWSSGRIVLDWGSDTTFQGIKSDWESDHWYFIAITWDESANSIEIFWGDEDTSPVEDVSTNSWTDSLAGLHRENDIMNSAARTAQVDGHIDEFRYYDVRRGRDDLVGDYREQLTGTEPNLVHYYEFEDDLTDSSGTTHLVASGSYSFSRDVPCAENGWRAEQIEVSVRDLKRLVVLNGTFENGYPGVNVDWFGDGIYNASGWGARREVLFFNGRQRAAFVDTSRKYVVLENEGYAVTSPIGYRHYNGTRIYWYQNVTNSQLIDEFVFSMNYYYQRGPVGTNFSGVFDFMFEIFDGSSVLWTWSIDPVSISQRGVWNSIGPLVVSIPGAPATFEARVSLNVHTNSSYVEITETDPDLDGDSANGQFVTFLVDDVSLTAVDVPTFESVDFWITSSETGPVKAIEDSGTGQVLLNYSFWNRASIPVSFAANTSISFEYSTKVSRMYRIYNSSSTMSLDDIGVAYDVGFDRSSNLSLFTFIHSYPEAENVGFVVHHPSDWENASVENSFGIDVTSQAIVGPGRLEMPKGAVDSVGWWSVKLNGPNYAGAMSTQVYDDIGFSWENESVFRSGSKIRCQVDIGTSLESPSFVQNLEVTWYRPIDNVWSSEVVSNMSGSLVVSSGRTLGPLNATPGDWMVDIFWTNGTEVAHRYQLFEVRHQLTVFPYTPHIEAELGENFTAAVYIRDQDNGEPILGGASIVGNWSGTEIQFSPNLAKGWWEADFNTSITGAGSFVIVVNVTMPYRYESNCTITVNVLTFTVMTVLGNQFVEIGPSRTYAAKFRYMFLDGTGISDANVSVFSWSGPAGGLRYNNTISVPGEPGNYSIEFSGDFGGVYVITVTGAKQDLATAATTLYLVVGPVSTDLGVAGEGLPDSLFFNQTYTFSLLYRTSEFVGIQGATVNVTYNPVTVVDWIDSGEGYYNVSVRVPAVGSFSVFLRFYKQGFAFADISFGFDAIEIPTVATALGFTGPYYESRTYEFALFYNSTLANGVVGADLTPSTAIRDFFRYTDSGDGWYNFTLTPSTGNWNATFWLAKVGYEESTFSIEFDVEKIPIILAPEHPLNQTYTRFEETVLSLHLVPIAADTGAVITGATVEYFLVDTTSDEDTILFHGTFVEESGVYYVNITVPAPGLYLLRVEISKNHHEVMTQEVFLSSEPDPGALLVRTFNAGLLGALAILSVSFVFLMGRRFYAATATRRNLELLALEGRLNDAKNLIGILVIHRSIGLPVYSRIIKGGFEESVLSSFIAAISQFRAEFSWDEPIWAAIPITEVITAVQTEVLICAMITVETASVRQKSQLEAFGREVGGLYDHEDHTLRQMFHTPELSEAFSRSFDPIFDSYFDGSLMTRYVGVKKDLPSHLSPVSEAMNTLKIDYGVTPGAIIRAVILLGHSERKAHQIAFEAIDNGYLIAGERKLPPPISPPE